MPVIKVKDCRKCPFIDGAQCSRYKRRHIQPWNMFGAVQPPDWCPLLKGDVVVKYDRGKKD